MTSPEQLSAILSTSPQLDTDAQKFSHLQVDISEDDKRFDANPLELFANVKDGLIATEGITGEDIVIMMQYEAGQTLSIRGIKNLLSWANEEIYRNQLQQNGEWKAMNTSDRTLALFGVKIDFGEEPVIPERTVA